MYFLYYRMENASSRVKDVLLANGAPENGTKTILRNNMKEHRNNQKHPSTRRPHVAVSVLPHYHTLLVDNPDSVKLKGESLTVLLSVLRFCLTLPVLRCPGKRIMHALQQRGTRPQLPSTYAPNLGFMITSKHPVLKTVPRMINELPQLKDDNAHLHIDEHY